MNDRLTKLTRLKDQRDAALLHAEQSAFAYFMECNSQERASAALVHEGIYCAMQTAGLCATAAVTPGAPDFSC